MLADSHLEHIVLERQAPYKFIQTLLKTDYIAQKAIEKAQTTAHFTSRKRSDLGQSPEKESNLKIFPHSQGRCGVCNGVKIPTDIDGFVVFTARW